jgi:hypothetical protein
MMLGDATAAYEKCRIYGVVIPASWNSALNVFGRKVIEMQGIDGLHDPLGAAAPKSWNRAIGATVFQSPCDATTRHRSTIRLMDFMHSILCRIFMTQASTGWGGWYIQDAKDQRGELKESDVSVSGPYGRHGAKAGEVIRG